MYTQKHLKIKTMVIGRNYPLVSCSIYLIHIDGLNANILFDLGTPYQRMDLIKALEKEELKTEDIDYVILSHLHFDHFGNIGLFKHAKIIMTEKSLQLYQKIMHSFKLAQKDTNPIETLAQVFAESFQRYKYFEGKHNGFHKAKTFANLMLKNSEIFYTLDDTLNSNRLMLLSISDDLLFDSLKVILVSVHTEEDLMLYLEDVHHNQYLLTGDVVPNSKFVYRLKDIDLKIPIEEEFYIMPGHAPGFLFRY